MTLLAMFATFILLLVCAWYGLNLILTYKVSPTILGIILLAASAVGAGTIGTILRDM